MARNTKRKEYGSGWIVFDALFDVILTVLVYSGKVIRAIVGIFLRN